VDAQVYTSADNDVQLTRMTWLFKPDDPPNRFTLEMIDRGVVAGASEEASKHVSASRHFEGDMLVGESRDETGGLVMVQRKLYAVDATGVVHLFITICAGEAGKLAACEKAQQSMQLTLPNPGSLARSSSGDRRDDLAYQLGRIVGMVLVGLLVIGIVLWIKKRS